MNLKDVLDDYGIKITEALKKVMKDKKMVASGQLFQGIEYHVKFFGNEYTLHIGFKDFIDYAAAADTGRKAGKQPPIDPILRWVKHRGLLPKKRLKDNAQSQRSLAYQIARKIGKKGTKGHNFWHPTIDPLIADLKADLKKVLKKEVQIELIKDIKKRGFTG